MPGTLRGVSTTSTNHAANCETLVPPPSIQAKSDYALELNLVTANIREPMARVESMIGEQLSSQYDELQPLLEYVAELGGKRFRPILVLLSAQAVGAISEETIRLATVVELVHTATLIHDDILDQAETRRHRPTLHRHNGIQSSILVGDWLFTQAYALANAGTSTIPGRWVAKAAKAICEGEIRQNHSVGQLSLTEDDYLSVLYQKTGSLCGASCELGAWSAGADTAQCEIFFQFGSQLGTAFQVHDDWLDYWGSQSRLGKRIGGDSEAGKPTLPLIRLLNMTCGSERVQLVQWIQNRTPADFENVRRMLEQYGISDDARELAKQLSRNAIANLSSSHLNSDRQALERLAILAIERGA